MTAVETSNEKQGVRLVRCREGIVPNSERNIGRVDVAEHKQPCPQATAADKDFADLVAAAGY